MQQQNFVPTTTTQGFVQSSEQAFKQTAQNLPQQAVGATKEMLTGRMHPQPAYGTQTGFVGGTTAAPLGGTGMTSTMLPEQATTYVGGGVPHQHQHQQ